jgi:hypothetical protein
MSTKEEQLLTACTNLDFETVKTLLSEDPEAGYQDPETGYGPLHKIILSAAQNETQNTAKAKEILEYLLANGAVWIQGMLRFSLTVC